MAAHEAAINRMVDIKNLTEKELDHLHKFYKRLSDLAEKEHYIPARTQSMRLKITTS